MYKYQKLADWIETQISEGCFLPNEKIPSLRDLQKQFEVSLSVAVQACRHLENRALIESKEKSGFIVCLPFKSQIIDSKTNLVPKISQPETHSLIGKIIELGLNPKLPPFAAGVPSPLILPLKKINQSFIYLAKNKPELIGQYAPSKGSLLLREHLAKRFIRKGVKVKAEEILITNGAIEALSIAIKSLSKSGDTIALESPVFFGVLPILKELKRKIIEIPAQTDSGIDLKILEKELNKKKITALIVSGTVQNPLGCLLPESKKKNLIKLANKYEFNIIEDNVYGECGYDDELLFPIKKYDTHNKVVYISSLSKISAPGLRVGWMIPGNFMQKCESIKTSQTLGSALITQEATAHFMETGGYKYHLRHFRKHIKDQVYAMRFLVLKYFPKGTKVTLPQGGFFLWIEIPQIGHGGTAALFNEALKNNLCYLPGSVFTQTKSYENFIRLSCTSPIDENIIKNTQRLGTFFQEHQKE